MATKKPTSPPAPKPRIEAVIPHPPPGAEPQQRTPRLDELERANESIRAMAEMANQQAAAASVKHVVELASTRVYQWRRTNMVELDELPAATDEKYKTRRVYRTSDGRSWIMLQEPGPIGGSSDTPIRVRPEAISYVEVELETGQKFADVIEWFQVTNEELERMRVKVEQDASAKAEMEAADKVIAKLLASAPKHVQTTAADLTFSNIEPTLETAEKLVAETGAKLVIAGSGTILVHAANGSELLSLVPDDAPRYTRKRLGHHDHKVRTLVTVLEQLGPLAVSWVRLGKRPASDSDAKQLANQLGPMGAFLP